MHRMGAGNDRTGKPEEQGGREQEFDQLLHCVRSKKGERGAPALDALSDLGLSLTFGGSVGGDLGLRLALRCFVGGDLRLGLVFRRLERSDLSRALTLRRAVG